MRVPVDRAAALLEQAEDAFHLADLFHLAGYRALWGGSDDDAADCIARAVADRLAVRVHDTFFAPARARQGAEAWDAAERAGTALGFRDAIAYALDEARPGAAAVPMPTGLRH